MTVVRPPGGEKYRATATYYLEIVDHKDTTCFRVVWKGDRACAVKTRSRNAEML
jgi:hypothetical protein